MTGYAPVNGLKMYYEVHGSGEPVVLLHGAFMTIPNNWTGRIGELSKTRKVTAVEMQGHGRTADIKREFSSENLADDVAALLDYLKIPARTSSATAAQHDTRHADRAHARHRPDGERLFRFKTAKAIKKLYTTNERSLIASARTSRRTWPVVSQTQPRGCAAQPW